MSLWNEINEYDKFPELPTLGTDFGDDFCTSSRGLRQFLNHSRRLSDDVIKQRLNSILNHNETKGKKFDKQQICDSFIQNVLIRSWNDRLRSLRFCEGQLLKIDKSIKEDERAAIDPRIDPYSQRDIENSRREKLEQYETIERFLRNEATVEEIIQGRTKEILMDSCGVSKLIDQLK